MLIIEIQLYELLQWLEKHPGLATWISTAATFFTFIVAWKALETWKNQKEYELLIDNLSHCNLAREYIIKLRLLFSDDIDITELESKISKLENMIEIYNYRIESLPFSKFLSKRVAIIQARQKRDQDLREKFLILRERNSVYRTKNDFYQFYDKVIQLDFEILNNAIYINNLINQLKVNFESLNLVLSALSH